GGRTTPGGGLAPPDVGRQPRGEHQVRTVRGAVEPGRPARARGPGGHPPRRAATGGPAGRPTGGGAAAAGCRRPAGAAAAVAAPRPRLAAVVTGVRRVDPPRRAGAQALPAADRAGRRPAADGRGAGRPVVPTRTVGCGREAAAGSGQENGRTVMRTTIAA